MSRLAVVGGGVIGTAVALAAVARGHEVVQLERDEEPRGASVRNFGLVWVCGRAAGRELELALEGRRRWEELAARAPQIGFRPIGSLLLARNPAELDVIVAAGEREDAGRRGLRVLTSGEVGRLDRRLGGIVGALHCRLDAVVEPAAALAALRALASLQGRFRFLPGRTVVAVDGGAALDHLGVRHEADIVVVCPGDALELIPLEAALRAGLRRRNLQMLETDRLAAPLPFALADGDALRYYPAFDLPERAGLPAPTAVVERLGVQLLVAPRADGRLTVGDTHVDDRPGAFGSEEEADEHLLRRLGELLGPGVKVRRRWTGTYLRRTDGADCVLVEEAPGGALLVAAAGGMGMTAAHAIPAEALDRAGL